jgi:hypothetical protein
MKAVQYSPNYCELAKKDLEENGIDPFHRFDNSHDLSILDDDNNRWYIASYQSADAATEAGINIEDSGILPKFAVLIPYGEAQS